MNIKNIHSFERGVTIMDKKAEIFEAGRELFLQKGFKDVNVSDITKRASVGVGTFYNYYSSKENLFLEIYFEENRQAKRKTIESLNMNDAPANIAKEYMMQCINIMGNNKILKEWYHSDISSQLHSYYRENGGEDVGFVRDVFAGLLDKWKAENRIREDIDNESILSLFDIFVYLDFHQEDILVPDFLKALHLLGEYMIKGFTTME